MVQLYAGLFFAVRNREGTFALNEIFPLTRLGAVREAELDYNEVDLTLMRVGRDYGWQAVAQLAGLLTIEDADESLETMLADMERTMAAAVAPKHGPRRTVLAPRLRRWITRGYA